MLGEFVLGSDLPCWSKIACCESVFQQKIFNFENFVFFREKNELN